MGVSTEQVLRARDLRIKRICTLEDAAGNTITLTPTEQLAVDQVVKVRCDGPRCCGGVNGAERDSKETTNYEWSEMSARTDPAAVPDGMARILILEAGMNATGKMVFCSPRCVSDWFLNGYVPALSPREQAVIDQANMEAAAKKTLTLVPAEAAAVDPVVQELIQLENAADAEQVVESAGVPVAPEAETTA